MPFLLRWQTSGGDPDKFLKYNYPEAKDLCKQFLTLVSGILVFSLTLSDKAVGVSTAPSSSKIVLVASWITMLGAIVACGLGLTAVTLAAGDAAYGGNRFLRLAGWAYSAIVLAGALFILGLCLLIAAAVFAVGAHPAAPGGHP